MQVKKLCTMEVCLTIKVLNMTGLTKFGFRHKIKQKKNEKLPISLQTQTLEKWQ